MTIKDYTIKVSRLTKIDFDQLQLDLKKKGVYKTQDELQAILINTFKQVNIHNKGKKPLTPLCNSCPCYDLGNKK